MTLLSQYKDLKVKFSQNVLYHMKNDFLVENSKSQKMTLTGFSQRGSHLCVCLKYCALNKCHFFSAIVVEFMLKY